MTHQDQSRLHRLLKILFQKWQLSESEQAKLLGFPLSEWSDGVFDSAALERAALLLNIHRGLRLLFPENPELRYTWMTSCNTAFDQRTPLNILCDEGVQGFVAVAGYLDEVMQR